MFIYDTFGAHLCYDISAGLPNTSYITGIYKTYVNINNMQHNVICVQNQARYSHLELHISAKKKFTHIRFLSFCFLKSLNKWISKKLLFFSFLFSIVKCKNIDQIQAINAFSMRSICKRLVVFSLSKGLLFFSFFFTIVEDIFDKRFGTNCLYHRLQSKGAISTS